MGKMIFSVALVCSLLVAENALAAGAVERNAFAQLDKTALSLEIPQPAKPPAAAPAFRLPFYTQFEVEPSYDAGLRRVRRGPLTGEERLAELDFVTGKIESVYSHLEGKQKTYGFSYEALKAGIRQRVLASASDAAYQAAMADLMRAFHDPHSNIYFYGRGLERDAAAQPVTNTLTEDGILITRIATLSQRYENDIVKGLGESLELAKKARALVVDVRGNSGGNDGYTWDYVAALIDHPIRTSIVSVRISSETLARYGGKMQDDPARPGWTPWEFSEMEPAGGSPFKGQVALLIDGGCVSSCEGTALMFKASGMAKLYGATTMGSSGFPVMIHLPYSNGDLRLSTWIQLQPDGTPIEDHGIIPDFPTDPAAALDSALANLRAAPPQAR